MSLVDRISDTNRRLALSADIALERGRRDVRDMRRADALEAEEARERLKRDANRNQEHMIRYDSAFVEHGARAPLPALDERPPEFRRRLFGMGQSLLPKGHELRKFRADEVGPSAILPLEKELFSALSDEAASPSGSNLPQTVDDPRAKREVTDSMGTKTVNWAAKEHYIKGMSRPARRVARIVDPTRGIAIWGQPFSRTSG
jgi:hypothetical protein